MDTNNKNTSINSLVADLLDEIAEQPIPQGAEFLLVKIQSAVENGIATDDMALEIIDLYPDNWTHLNAKIAKSVAGQSLIVGELLWESDCD